MSDTLIIVPTYNEADNIDDLLGGIFRHAPEVSVVFVDDNSRDGTKDKIHTWMKRTDKVQLLERPAKMGLGSAYVTGFKWGLEQGYKQLVEMDADLSHKPEYLPVMLATLGEGDVAVGSRYVNEGATENWGLMRRLISRFGSLYARVILGTPVYDQTGGFNGWRADVLRAINLDDVRSEGYSFQIELKYRAFRQGFKVQEFPIVFCDRRVGQSKMSSRIVLEAFYRVWQIRFLV